MSIIFVMGGAVILEGVVNGTMWLTKQVKTSVRYNVAVQRIERNRRWNKLQKRWA